MSTDEITIRAATLGDEAMLSDLLAASYAQLTGYDPHGLANAMPLMRHANPKLLASGTYYIAEIGGVAAGCGGWSVEKPGSGDIIEGIGHIRHFGTHPAFLRRGVARRLLAHCIDEARRLGMRTLMSQSTLPAEAFYAAAGFQRLGVIDVEMAPGVVLPAVEMRLDLSQ
jgi:N-acetylglutamate synthase-like GNAT family acetyltransferase